MERIDLKILKESNPIQVAEYATSRDIHEHPAFAWWVPYVLQKHDVIVSAVNLRLRKCSHKYGIELPRLVRDAIDLDCRNGNTFWADALTKGVMSVLHLKFLGLRRNLQLDGSKHLVILYLI